MDKSFFIEVAKVTAQQSSCLRRKFGCVIVDPLTNQILSTGYNGSPIGKDHCDKEGWCLRDDLNISPGERYECCKSVHSEQNALLQAGRSANGSHMYIAGYDAKTSIPITKPIPCFLCTKMALNSRISKCFIWSGKRIIEIDLNNLYDSYVEELYAQMKDEPENKKVKKVKK